MILLSYCKYKKFFYSRNVTCLSSIKHVFKTVVDILFNTIGCFADKELMMATYLKELM